MIPRRVTRLTQWLPDPTPPAWQPKKVSLQPLKEESEPEPEETYELQANPLGFRLGEHWSIVGATGSGKTYFVAKGLLGYFAHYFPHVKVYILDSTDDPNLIKWLPTGIHHVYNDNTPPDTLNAPGTLVWTPRYSKLPLAYATWLRRLNDAREPQIIVIDEIASITGEALQELEVIFKQMRKHGGTVIGLTQQIARVDTTIFSQSSHYVQFGMGAERYDKAQARAYLNIAKEDQRDPLYDYGFFYRRVRSQQPYQEFSGMDAFFRGQHV